jgi:hypothetical protein
MEQKQPNERTRNRLMPVVSALLPLKPYCIIQREPVNRKDGVRGGYRVTNPMSFAVNAVWLGSLLKPIGDRAANVFDHGHAAMTDGHPAPGTT